MDIFKAIADPTRREILLMLIKEPSSINTIADHFKMSRPAISKHIKILDTSGLLTIQSSESDGRQRFCYVQLEAMKEVNDYLAELQKFWDLKLRGLGSYLDSKD